MKFFEGDLFDAPNKAIGHGVNLQGVMGAGIAVSFCNRYPEMMPSYEQWCANPNTKPGDILPYNAKDGKTIVNWGTQRFPGRDATYGALATAATRTAGALHNADISSIAIPRIGCGIGGLDYDAVTIIIGLVEHTFRVGGVNFEFHIYTPKEAPK